MGLFDKLKQGLKKTHQLLKTDVRDIFKAGEILDESKLERFESRRLGEYTDKLLSAMRSEFGGHAEKKA